MDDLADESDADVFPFVHGDWNDLPAHGVNHPVVLSTGERPNEVQLPQVVNHLLRLKRRELRHVQSP